MLKKILKSVTAFLLVVTLSSCASNAILKEPATIKKHDNAMFWELNAIDKYGEPSKLYVLGTVHVGDNRLYPLPTIIDEAFINSDNVAGEISGEDNNKITKETLERQLASMERESKRIEETGKKLSDYLSENQKALAYALVGGEANFKNFEMYEPWVLISALTLVPIAYSGYDPTSSYDTYFTSRCLNEGRTLEGLDSLETQFDIIEFGDWDTQLQMLKDTLDDILENQVDPGKDVKELYEKYLTGDEKLISDYLTSEIESDDTEYADEYNQLLFVNRNTDWATKFAKYLNEGGTTFIFAGCGHFVGPDSVFAIMAENGYLDY